MNLEVLRLSDLAGDLHEAKKWLSSLGFRKFDRIHEAIRIVEQAAIGIERARQTGEPTKLGNIDTYHFGIIEAAEFSDVWKAFRDDDAARIRSILTRALQGPLRPRHETPPTADARNMMFQLSLAAEWKLLGASVEVGEPDVTLICSGIPFAVECKRPFKDDSIRANVKAAASQIRSKPRDNPTLGIIAVSVSRVLDSGRRLYTLKSTSNVAGLILQEQVAQLYKAEREKWNDDEWFAPEVVAVLFHARAIVVTDEHPINRMRSTVLGAVGKTSSSFDPLRSELLLRYGDNANVE